jgi:hypothetical protein
LIVLLVFSPALGIDYAAKKDSSLKGGLADTILRVRSASIVKMIDSSHRPDSKVTEALSRWLFENLWIELILQVFGLSRE